MRVLFWPETVYNNHMATKKKKKKKKQGRIKAVYVIMGFVFSFCIVGGIFLSQQTRLTSIAEEREQLQSELDALKVEEERLTRMIEYMQTNDYLLQYAREKLGYVYPDDYKFKK